jgi:hypothetical protein
VKRGDTFLWCPSGVGKPHLYIIISDPAKHAGKFVVVNLTSSQGGKFAYTLKPGQHPFIIKDSDVNFGDAISTTDVVVAQRIAQGEVKMFDPMPTAIVDDVARIALTHPAFPPIFRKLL